MKLSQLITHVKLRKNVLQVFCILTFKHANEALIYIKKKSTNLHESNSTESDI